MKARPALIPSLLRAAATVAAIGTASAVSAATYYVSAGGADAADGLSPRRAWQTLARVNAADLRPGDRVLFRCGDTWRGTLVPHSGGPNAPITYAAYGRGEKPLLLGLVSRSAPGDWRNEGAGLWSTGGSARPDLRIPVDVGNVIYGRETAGGVKRWTRADLADQGDFWYDRADQALWVRSDRNPAERYGQVECALRRHIIDESGCGWVTYENLSLKYGGAHGIGGANTQHITVRSCDLSYIGGGDQYGDGRRVRFGNGIEFWAGAHDNLVERCRLWQVYDAALTNQSMGDPVEQANITYRDNVIRDCEYSFEYWNRPAASRTRNIRFVHNTCLDAGSGWGHTQRPDPSGCHLRFYSSDAQAEGIAIEGNVFCGAVENAFYAPSWSVEAVRALRMDYNRWWQPAGTMIAVAGRGYPMSAFADYRRDFGLESHSRCERFVGAARPLPRSAGPSKPD